MNNLVDSSVWIEYFRGNEKYLFINDLINNNTICTNDIILTELLPSIIHKKEHKLAELLSCIKKYELNIDWQEIRGIQLLNIQNGTNNIGVSDIIIAQNCIQNELKIIVNDKHFEAMARYIPLKIF
ncbi:MAG: PIN domain-containing protein [Treponema sp.]|nr:PIN domain-containing protein [Treponema sp.]